MKDFLKSWGWAIPTVMIPLCLMAAKWMFVTRTEFTPVRDGLAKTSQALSYHMSDASGIHESYQKRSETFVPRIELSPILVEIKQDQKATNQKLDRVLEELRKR
jgi:hypothetical protein